MDIRIALPKGDLLQETSGLAEAAGWGLRGYRTGERLYRLKSETHPGLRAKMLHERDIPIQVAVGNYDLGICGRDWAEELTAKYPSSEIIQLKSRGYGGSAIFAATSRAGDFSSLGKIRKSCQLIRIAAEYPNLAESFALSLRLGRFVVWPLWGATCAYPPDTADVVLISSRDSEAAARNGLLPLARLLDSEAVLIANRSSWEKRDMSHILEPFYRELSGRNGALPKINLPEVSADFSLEAVAPEEVRLALPDGHQQRHVVRLLEKAGLKIDGYPSDYNRRPKMAMGGVAVKVLRPQDMPLLVANGSFDIAITGRDWLTDHLYQFPQSPVTELADLKYGWVRLVAVVSREVPAESLEELRQYLKGQERNLRIATEYTNIADRYARDNHLGTYRVIPTWGATEAFLPEDADLLIENTETGGTIARHNLKIIDTLFESTACLIGNKDTVNTAAKGAVISRIAEVLAEAVQEGTDDSN